MLIAAAAVAAGAGKQRMPCSIGAWAVFLMNEEDRSVVCANPHSRPKEGLEWGTRVEFPEFYSPAEHKAWFSNPSADCELPSYSPAAVALACAGKPTAVCEPSKSISEIRGMLLLWSTVTEVVRDFVAS